ncbi:MAG: hypothetical protein ACOXZ4_05045 [Sphaerochaetaceae bacterium]
MNYKDQSIRRSDHLSLGGKLIVILALALLFALAMAVVFQAARYRELRLTEQGVRKEEAGKQEQIRVLTADIAQDQRPQQILYQAHEKGLQLQKIVLEDATVVTVGGQ